MVVVPKCLKFLYIKLKYDSKRKFFFVHTVQVLAGVWDPEVCATSKGRRSNEREVAQYTAVLSLIMVSNKSN